MRDRSEHSEMCPWVIGGECDCKKITVEIPISNPLTTALARAESAEKELSEIRDIPLARQQFPDGAVPGNTVECAVGWYRWYLYQLRDVTPKLTEQITTLETRNRQLVQAMGEAVKALESVVCDYNNPNDLAYFETRGKGQAACEITVGDMLQCIKALALLKEMGKE